MKNLRRVYHVNQNQVEYYRFCTRCDWVAVSRSEAGDWIPGSFDHIELRHSMSSSKGTYGPYISI